MAIIMYLLIFVLLEIQKKQNKKKHATKQIFLLFNVRNLLYSNKDFSGRPTELLILREILFGTKIVHGSPLRLCCCVDFSKTKVCIEKCFTKWTPEGIFPGVTWWYAAKIIGKKWKLMLILQLFAWYEILGARQKYTLVIRML